MYLCRVYVKDSVTVDRIGSLLKQKLNYLPQNGPNGRRVNTSIKLLSSSITPCCYRTRSTPSEQILLILAQLHFAANRLPVLRLFISSYACPSKYQSVEVTLPCKFTLIRSKVQPIRMTLILKQL